MCSNTDHRLNCETHARLRLTNCLVLGIVRNVGCAVEKLVDTMSAIRPDHAAVFAFGMFLDDVAIFPEKSAWLCDFNGLVQALSCSLGDPYSVWICQRFVSNVIGLIQVCMETAVVD